MSKACYPGSFDPFTNGHLDVVKRISHLFEEVYIVISNNISKNNFFTPNERLNLIQKILKDYPNVKVVTYSGLVVKFCQENKVDVIIRGLRNIHDYENEYTLFEFNKDLAPEIETLVLFPNRNSRIVSSSAIKELLTFKADISKYVPKLIEEAIKQKIATK